MKKPYLYIAAAILYVGCFGQFHTAHAAITFDSSSTMVRFAAKTSATTSIQIGTGSNEFQLACITLGSTAQSVSMTTFGGNVGTLIFTTNGDGSTYPIYLYYYAGGNTTANAEVVSSTFGGNATGNLGASSFFGVQQANPIDSTSTSHGSTQYPSSTIVTNNAGEFVSDCLAAGGTAPTFTPDGAQIQTGKQTTSVIGATSYLSVPTAQSTSTGWALSGNKVTTYASVSFIPAAAANPTGIPMLYVAGSLDLKSTLYLY